jgi:3',5'-cyclic AMP phosphodiesterase CpdA
VTTVVQLSDTHLLAGGALAYGRVDTLAGLKRAAASLIALAPRLGGIDAIVATGDIADRGEPDAYRLFREIMAPVTAATGAPLHAVPGNHDARGAFAEAFGGRRDGGTLDFCADAGALRLIGLDTTVPGASHGQASTAQAAWVAAQAAAAPDRPAILFLHHPPFAVGVGFMDVQRLLDPAALAAAVAASPSIRLVACGHVHRAVTSSWAGIPAMIAPAPSHAVRLDLRPGAPACFDLEPGAVLVHRWADGRLASQTCLLDPAPGPFPF